MGYSATVIPYKHAFSGPVYKNTTENTGWLSIGAASFCLFFLELAALEVARVLVWGSGVAGGMAPVDHRNLLPVAAY